MGPEDADHHAHDKAKANWTRQGIRCVAELDPTETAAEEENRSAKEFGSEYYQALFNLLCRGSAMKRMVIQRSVAGFISAALTDLILWLSFIRMSTAIVRSQSETIDVHRYLYIQFSDHFEYKLLIREPTL